MRNMAAVIEKKNEALKVLLSDTQHREHNCGAFDCPVEIAKQALAITPEKMRLVEVGNVETIGGYPDTSQQICYLKIRANNGTKLYTIDEVKE